MGVKLGRRWGGGEACGGRLGSKVELPPHFVPSRCSITARSSFMLHDNDHACEASQTRFCLRSHLLPLSRSSQPPAKGAANAHAAVHGPRKVTEGTCRKATSVSALDYSKPLAILASPHSVRKAKLRMYFVLCRGVRLPSPRGT